MLRERIKAANYAEPMGPPLPREMAIVRARLELDKQLAIKAAGNFTSVAHARIHDLGIRSLEKFLAASSEAEAAMWANAISV